MISSSKGQSWQYKGWPLFFFFDITYHSSFDRRKTDDGKRWSAKAPFGDRAYFQENPYISNLIIKEVRKEVCVVQLMVVMLVVASSFNPLSSFLCLNLANFLLIRLG